MKEKRMLAVLGSPHRNGTTASMLECMVKTARGNGWKVDRVNLYEKEIGFCKGCRICLETERCVVEDDIQEIARLLKGCDVVILAAPVYWANVPGIVKNMFDRLLGVAMEETCTFPKPRLSRRQKYVLLTACNTPEPFAWMFGQCPGAFRSMSEFFKTSGMSCGGKIACASTGRIKGLSKAAVRRLERCASML